MALPRRTWESDSERLADEMTALLKKPGGTMRLFPIQAVALKEAWEQQGCLLPIGVGKGKTLVSLLLPFVLESERPVLMLPAKLIEKTMREWRVLSQHWKIPNWTRMISYEILGRVQAKDKLDEIDPDLLIGDEAHKLKDKTAAVTKRVKRLIEERRKANKKLRVTLMSGTFTRRSIRDYEHLVKWTLRDGSPLPTEWTEVERWANALDDLKNPLQRVEPGALLYFVSQEDFVPGDDLATVRRAYARRLTQTPGVVASGVETLGTSLQIAEAKCVPSDVIDGAFKTLRLKWELPDGWELIDGVAVWRHARELALGFFYVWDPRPPTEWLAARAIWCSFARQIIKQGKYDSEQDVALHFSHAPEYQEWAKVRPTFEPNQRPVWLCSSVLEMAAKWTEKHPRGIVWTEHIAFGQALEHCTGIPYFGEMGLDRRGQYIEDATGPIIASVDANRDGRNLQFKWQDNLIMTSPSAGLDYEQLLGRTHRTGQEADTVTADIYVGCIEDAIAFDKALASARYEQDSTLQPMKLCYADIAMPREGDAMCKGGARWRK